MDKQKVDALVVVDKTTQYKRYRWPSRWKSRGEYVIIRRSWCKNSTNKGFKTTYKEKHQELKVLLGLKY